MYKKRLSASTPKTANFVEFSRVYGIGLFSQQHTIYITSPTHPAGWSRSHKNRFPHASLAFKLFLKDVKKQIKGYDYDEIRVVITGDIAHQKINISNEQLLLTSWFISEIVEKISKVIIIPGNHDFLENNHSRVDSITPMVELLKNPDISFFKDFGVYDDDNIKWKIHSI